jgi:hypothetical protein
MCRSLKPQKKVKILFNITQSWISSVNTIPHWVAMSSIRLDLGLTHKNFGSERKNGWGISSYIQLVLSPPRFKPSCEESFKILRDSCRIQIRMKLASRGRIKSGTEILARNYLVVKLSHTLSRFFHDFSVLQQLIRYDFSLSIHD